MGMVDILETHFDFTKGYVRMVDLLEMCFDLRKGYRIVGNFRENLREFHGFVAICESILREILGRGIF